MYVAVVVLAGIITTHNQRVRRQCILYRLKQSIPMKNKEGSLTP